MTASGAVVLDTQGYNFNHFLTGINVISNPGATGSAGAVTLTADTLQILNGERSAHRPSDWPGVDRYRSRSPVKR